MIGPLTGDQAAFFAILVVGFVLLLTEWLRTDLVAVLLILALYLSGVLSAEKALSGFGSEPAIVVAGIFVLSGALHRTGLSEVVGQWIGRLAGSSYTRVVLVMMPSVAVLSAFTHQLATTAVMLPVVLNLSREREIPPSKLLMPLSFAASLGTTITIISAPAFLIASGALQEAGRPGLGIFAIAPIGLTLSLLGTLFVVVAGRFLLPVRRGTSDSGSDFRLGDDFTEIVVLESSPFAGKTVGEFDRDPTYDMRIVRWVRGGQTVDRSRKEEVFRVGDVLLVRIDPDQLATVQEDPRVELRPVSKYGDSLTDGVRAADTRLAQVVIGPRADLVGQTLAEVDFRQRFGVLVVGLWRQHGWVQRELSRIRLREGDVLVVQGEEEALARMAADPAFLMMMAFHGEARPRRKAVIAGVVMLVTIVLAATKLVSIEMAALLGAAAMVLVGCVTMPQAYRSIDMRIYVFIAGALPLGTAMEETGASRILAGGLQHVTGDLPPALVLAVLFIAVGVLTQFMSDAATTALFAPVAVALARALGHAPEAYVITVAMAAVASFLTPIGHHGNLLVYGPGGYRFSDFARVGTPLTLLVGVVVVLLTPVFWPL